MTGKGGLDRTLVRDVLHVFMFPPSTVSPDDSVEEMLRVMIRDTHTRHVYVVDAENRLVGVVRMNRVVEYLFPHVLLRGLAEEEMVWGTHFLESIGAKVVGDIMNDTPCYVLGTDPLSKVGEILTEEKINELPVVDEDRRLIGQVNVYQIINNYLNPSTRRRTGS